jgi:Ni,Fe-hydrogenase III small subunit
VRYPLHDYFLNWKIFIEIDYLTHRARVHTHTLMMITLHAYTQIPLDLLVVAVGGLAILGGVWYLRSKAKNS